MRMPPEVVDYLDALVEQRRSRLDAETAARLHRADVLVWLLSRTAPPTNPSNPLERRLVAAHKAAFGDGK